MYGSPVIYVLALLNHIQPVEADTFVSNHSVPAQSSLEQEAAQTGTPVGNCDTDAVLTLPDGSLIGRLLYPDEMTDTSSGAQVRFKSFAYVTSTLCYCYPRKPFGIRR